MGVGRSFFDQVQEYKFSAKGRGEAYGCTFSFSIAGGKWLQIQRTTHDTVGLKICFDKVREPDEFHCRIHEDAFVDIILDAIQTKWKQQEK